MNDKMASGVIRLVPCNSVEVLVIRKKACSAGGCVWVEFCESGTLRCSSAHCAIYIQDNYRGFTCVGQSIESIRTIASDGGLDSPCIVH